MAQPLNNLGALWFYLHKKGRNAAGRRILQVRGAELVRATVQPGSAPAVPPPLSPQPPVHPAGEPAPAGTPPLPPEQTPAPPPDHPPPAPDHPPGEPADAPHEAPPEHEEPPPPPEPEPAKHEDHVPVDAPTSKKKK